MRLTSTWMKSTPGYVLSILTVALILLNRMVSTTQPTTIDKLYPNSGRTDQIQIRNGNLHVVIEQITNTSVRISCKRTPATSSIHRKELDESQLRITYNIAAVFRTMFETQSGTCGDTWVRSNQENEFAICIDNMGGHYGDHEAYNFAEHHCKEHELYMGIGDGSEQNSTIVNDLLPGLPYAFNTSVVYRKDDRYINLQDNPVKYLCMNETSPLQSPQTNNNCFDIRSSSRGYRTVRLLWKPVPPLLYGSKEINYTISCKGEGNETGIYTEDVQGANNVGFVEIDKNIAYDQSYQCTIRSKNNFGVSEKNSIITIPRQENVLKPSDKFKFFVLSSDEKDRYKFTLTWSGLSTMYPELKNVTPSYTIYWCTSHICENIEGILKTDENELELSLDKRDAHAFQFGLSVETNLQHSTGIIWSECIQPEKADKLGPLDISKFHVPDNNHTSLHLSWEFKDQCKSIIALVSKYEFRYCALEPVNPCVVNNGSILNIERVVNLDDTSICHNITIGDKLITQYTLKSLKPSTLYAIQMRYHLQGDDRLSEWSSLKFTHSGASPSDRRPCPANQSWVMLISLIGGSLVTMIIVCLVMKPIIVHVCKLAKTYKGSYKRTSNVVSVSFKDDAINSSDYSLNLTTDRFPMSQDVKLLWSNRDEPTSTPHFGLTDYEYDFENTRGDGAYNPIEKISNHDLETRDRDVMSCDVISKTPTGQVETGTSYITTTPKTTNYRTTGPILNNDDNNNNNSQSDTNGDTRPLDLNANDYIHMHGDTDGQTGFDYSSASDQDDLLDLDDVSVQSHPSLFDAIFSKSDSNETHNEHNE